MKHKLTNFLLATALLFSSACSDEDWRGGGSTEEYIEIGEITVNESPESRAHDNSDNWIWVANEKIIVSAYDKDGKFLASGTYQRNMENTAWSSDSPLARVGVTYKVTTTVPTAEEINSQNDAYNYVLSDYLESTSALLDDKGVLTATLAHQTVDVVAVVTKGEDWESDEAFYEGLSGYTATFYADRDYTVKGLAVAGNDESVDYNDNTDAGLAPGKKTYIFRAHIDAAKLAVAYGGGKTALLYLEDASGMKLPGTYTRPDGVENGKRLKVTLTLNAPSPFAARSAEKDASALKCGVAVVEPWLGRAIPSTLWNGSDVTSVTPVGSTYTINTAAELAWVAQETNTSPNTFEGKTIKLANDISLGGQPWTPIGTFTGTFDGNGCTISGLKVSVSTNAGLFETIGTSDNPIGIVKNLGVIGSITSNCTSPYAGNSAGGIAGKNYGTIQNCYTSVTVTCNPTNDMCNAGGIAGSNHGTIQNCYTTEAVTNEKGQAGGIAGENSSAQGGAVIQYCYATGDIKGNQAGGITGENNDGIVQNCIALNSSITGTSTDPKVGRIAGFHGGYVGAQKLADNHAAPSIPGTWADKDGAKMNGADLTKDNFTGAGATAFAGWETANWDFSTAANLPTLNGFKANQPVKDVERAPFLEVPTIKTQKELAAIASDLSGSYKLGGNITLSGDWTPIAGEFTGTLDGCGFVISGLKVSVTVKAGLFETIGKNGTVKNLGVTGESVTVTGGDIGGYAGGIAGYSEGTIQNCYTSVAVTASSDMNGAGGIVGNNDGTIKNCYTTGAVTNEKGFAGGIAGKNTKDIQYCYATGIIKGSKAGGITGENSLNTKYCIALNASITGTTSAGRIAGGTSTGFFFTTNYAALSIPGAWEGKGDKKMDGIDLTATSFTAAIATAFTGWNDADWDFSTAANLPILMGFKTADQPVKDVARAPFLEVPVTTITDQKGLAAIKSNLAGSYKLGGNITLSGDWTPIAGDFTGTLDGCGYTISGLKVSVTDSKAGLFETIGKNGTVKNLGITSGSVTGEYYAGSIAGENKGTIENCYTNATVTSPSSAGGIVGVNSLMIQNCYTTGAVSSEKQAGGIAGANYRMIQNCYTTGAITCEKGKAGGIAGMNMENSFAPTIQYCYATGIIKGNQAGGIIGVISTKNTIASNCIALNDSIIGTNTGEYSGVGRIIGYKYEYTASLNDNYAALSIPGAWTADDKVVTGISGADLPSSFATDRANIGVFVGWEATNWNIETSNLPTLQGFNAKQPVKERAPFLEVPVTTIKTRAQLAAIKDNLSGSYKLGGNIILSGNWTPLGDNFNGFTGTLDGCGYTINNLTVNVTGKNNAGLFGYIGKDGTVKNLGVTGSVTLTDGVYAGGIAGYSYGKITNCYTNVTVSATGTGFTYAGGIAGVIDGVTAVISNCFTTGDCTVSASIPGTAIAGGIVGSASAGRERHISYCYATGTVEAKGEATRKYAGGIAGMKGGTITGCIALNKGGITGTNSMTNRIAGNSSNGCTITNCYASPAIPGTWSNIGATALDGADLTTANFINSNDVFTDWVPRDWRLGDNWQFEAKDFTNLPTLLTTGLIPEDIPLAGQTALARESFLMLIKTKAQLIAFRNAVNETPNDYKGKTIILAADINLGNENWIPIGKAESSSFMGTFDGGGHRISGLTVTLNGSSAQYGGLFGYIGSGGCVKNLGVSGGKVDVTSPEFAYAGGIAAKNIGKIENCYTDITVKVSAIYAHAGGIAGLNGVDSSNSSSISNCYAVGNVASSYYSGGIAGWSVWGSISNCFATGKVDGKNAAGGITTQSSQSVSNCIALNTGGITCTNANGKCRISYENKESYASPLIPGTWNNAAMDGTSLAWNNYMTAVGTWPSASWSNTKNSAKLPILKGFGTNQPAALLRWVSFLPVK